MARKTVGMSRGEYDRIRKGRQYPANIGAAADELRQRGYDANVDTLNYLIRKGVIDEAPEGPRSQPSWTKKRIDQAAKWMEQNGWYSPKGWFWNVCDIDPVQEHEARMSLGGDSPDNYAMVIFPGSPRRVAYVPVECIKEK
jgi:hypothetical protein